MYRGIIKNVFIPGVIKSEGTYSGIMDAKYLGFNIQVLEDLDSSNDVFVGKTIIVIEPDTNETAELIINDMVSISSTFFTDVCDCMMISDDETYMIINLSPTPYLKRYK